MGVNALSGRTVKATDRRHDLQGQAYQTRINPGSGKQVPSSSVRTGRQDLNEGDRSWRRQERAQAAAGQAIDGSRSNDWNSFLGGKPRARALNNGSVEIDGKRAAQIAQDPSLQEAKSKLKDDKATGWDRAEAAYGMAANFAETQQDKKGFLSRLRGPGLLGFSLSG